MAAQALGNPAETLAQKDKGSIRATKRHALGSLGFDS
jgi:hypothetical protein